MTGATSEHALRCAADMFHEIVSAFASEDLVVDARTRNRIVAEKLRNLRSRDQLKKIASDGFELCVRALAQIGAPGVTAHECSDQVLGEQPWGGGDE